MEPDPWRTSLLSPTPSISDGDDDDEPVRKITSLSRDAELARALDLDSRPDFAQVTITPFTISAQRADQQFKANERKANNNKGKKGDVGEKRAGKSIEPAIRDEPRARPGPEPAIKEDPKKKGKNARDSWGGGGGWSGWQTADGSPIPHAPPAKKSLITMLDDIQKKKTPKARAKKQAKGTATTVTKGKGRKSKTKEKEKEKTENITFTRIPANAGPSDEFPIVKGLEKQKNLPMKANKRKIDIANELSDSSQTSSIPSLDIDRFVRGLAPVKSTGVKKDKTDDMDQGYESIDPPSDEEAKLKFTNANSRFKKGTLSKYFNNARASGTSTSATMPSMGESGPTDPSDVVHTPREAQGTHSNPSTITHVSLGIHHHMTKNVHHSSSSQLPYSSPLQDKRNEHEHIIKPKPVRSGIRDIAKLEAMAEVMPNKTVNRKGFIPPRPTQSPGPQNVDNEYGVDAEYELAKARAHLAKVGQDVLNRPRNFTQAKGRKAVPSKEVFHMGGRGDNGTRQEWGTLTNQHRNNRSTLANFETSNVWNPEDTTRSHGNVFISRNIRMPHALFPPRRLHGNDDPLGIASASTIYTPKSKVTVWTPPAMAETTAPSPIYTMVRGNQDRNVGRGPAHNRFDSANQSRLEYSRNDGGVYDRSYQEGPSAKRRLTHARDAASPENWQDAWRARPQTQAQAVDNDSAPRMPPPKQNTNPLARFALAQPQMMQIGRGGEGRAFDF